MFKQLFTRSLELLDWYKGDRTHRARKQSMRRLRDSILACAPNASTNAIENLCRQEGYFHAVHNFPPVPEKLDEPGYLQGYREGQRVVDRI